MIVTLADRWGCPQTVIENMPYEHFLEMIALETIRRENGPKA